jgi:KilA-N domain
LSPNSNTPAQVEQDSLITHPIGNALIGQRVTDGYINATVLCQASGKNVADYLRLGSTNEFLRELSQNMGIPIVSLVEVRPGRGGGTWVHPQVAVNLAQWCSPRFAVLVSKWVFDWLTRRQEPPPPERVPVYPRRLSLAYRMQMGVPEGHWTVFDKCSNLLILVECDLRLPVERYDLLDGSVGIHWSRFRTGKIWAGERVRYEHIFPDKRGVQVAWAYVLEELPFFERWLRGTYIPYHLPTYLEAKYELPEPAINLIERATRILTQRP